MRRRMKRKDEEAEVNITPMLDVVFIMLIFFIVTATFVKEDGLDLIRPDPNEDQQASSPVAPITIRISNENDVYMFDDEGNERVVDVASVEANVSKARAEQPKAPVLIFAEDESETGVVVSVMDQAKSAGAQVTLAQN